MRLSFGCCCVCPRQPLHRGANPCDAKPRYILVTVLELDFYTRSQSKDGSGLVKHEAISGKIPNGRLQMIDRCGNGVIQMSDNNGIGPGKGKPGKAIIEDFLYSEGGEIRTLLRYFVKESMADLCRAMKDCSERNFVTTLN